MPVKYWMTCNLAQALKLYVSPPHGQCSAWPVGLVGLLSDRAGPLEDLEEVSYLLWQAHDICEGADPTVLSALPGSGRRRSRSPVVRPPQTATDSGSQQTQPSRPSSETTAERIHNWREPEFDRTSASSDYVGLLRSSW